MKMFLTTIAVLLVGCYAAPDNLINGGNDIQVPNSEPDEATRNDFLGLLNTIEAPEMEPMMAYLKHWTCMYYAMPANMRTRYFENDLPSLLARTLQDMVSEYQSLMEIVENGEHETARELLESIQYGQQVAGQDWRNMCRERYDPDEDSDEILREEALLTRDMTQFYQDLGIIPDETETPESESSEEDPIPAMGGGQGRVKRGWFRNVWRGIRNAARNVWRWARDHCTVGATGGVSVRCSHTF